MSGDYCGGGRGVAGLHLEQRRVAYDRWNLANPSGHAGLFKNSIAGQDIAFRLGESHTKWVSNHKLHLLKKAGPQPKAEHKPRVVKKVGLLAVQAIGVTIAGEYEQ
jgi:hypothetical protein